MFYKLLSTFVERPLCCLAFHHILRCSVFKVQTPVSFETRSKRTSLCPLPSIFNSKLVEIVGIEPATSCLQGRRSPSWAISPSISFRLLVGPSGLEPPTLRLSVVRSSQLSYRPILPIEGVPSKLNNVRQKRTDLRKSVGMVTNMSP